ncbi:hypothetical protein NQ315_015980 [Exocentrus adspersus]|uniref:Uncharacterized protein n=1 Tax=Exocentrus adspersus TaxID=1586481 RepID=A0AAV8VMA1_9CUCU|nr:hypothetical protein NQ315_015980 [Exocentrus adspersus]
MENQEYKFEDEEIIKKEILDGTRRPKNIFDRDDVVVNQEERLVLADANRSETQQSRSRSESGTPRRRSRTRSTSRAPSRDQRVREKEKSPEKDRRNPDRDKVRAYSREREEERYRRRSRTPLRPGEYRPRRRSSSRNRERTEDRYGPTPRRSRSPTPDYRKPSTSRRSPRPSRTPARSQDRPISPKSYYPDKRVREQSPPGYKRRSRSPAKYEKERRRSRSPRYGESSRTRRSVCAFTKNVVTYNNFVVPVLLVGTSGFLRGSTAARLDGMKVAGPLRISGVGPRILLLSRSAEVAAVTGVPVDPQVTTETGLTGSGVEVDRPGIREVDRRVGKLSLLFMRQVKKFRVRKNVMEFLQGVPGAEYWVPGPIRPGFPPVPPYYPAGFFPRMPGAPILLPPRMSLVPPYAVPYRQRLPVYNNRQRPKIPAATPSSADGTVSTTVEADSETVEKSKAGPSHSEQGSVTIQEVSDSESHRNVGNERSHDEGSRESLQERD